jgi:hypothetical protein
MSAQPRPGQPVSATSIGFNVIVAKMLATIAVDPDATPIEIDNLRITAVAAFRELRPRNLQEAVLAATYVTDLFLSMECFRRTWLAELPHHLALNYIAKGAMLSRQMTAVLNELQGRQNIAMMQPSSQQPHAAAPPAASRPAAPPTGNAQPAAAAQQAASRPATSPSGNAQPAAATQAPAQPTKAQPAAATAPEWKHPMPSEPAAPRNGGAVMHPAQPAAPPDALRALFLADVATKAAAGRLAPAN